MNTLPESTQSEVRRDVASEASRQCRALTDILATFTGYIGKRLPSDVMDKLSELRAKEEKPLAQVVYDSMFENLDLADRLDRPCCQDTGALQYFIRAGARFPLLGELGGSSARRCVRPPVRRHCGTTRWRPSSRRTPATTRV